MELASTSSGTPTPSVGLQGSGPGSGLRLWIFFRILLYTGKYLRGEAERGRGVPVHCNVGSRACLGMVVRAVWLRELGAAIARVVCDVKASSCILFSSAQASVTGARVPQCPTPVWRPVFVRHPHTRPRNVVLIIPAHGLAVIPLPSAYPHPPVVPFVWRCVSGVVNTRDCGHHRTYQRCQNFAEAAVAFAKGAVAQ